MFSFSRLLAIAMDDFTIVVVEVDTGNIVGRAEKPIGSFLLINKIIKW